MIELQLQRCALQTMHHAAKVGVYLSAVVQSDSVVIEAKQSVCISRKQTVMLHFQCIQVVVDVIDSAARACNQMNAWKTVAIHVICYKICYKTHPTLPRSP